MYLDVRVCAQMAISDFCERVRERVSVQRGGLIFVPERIFIYYSQRFNSLLFEQRQRAREIMLRRGIQRAMCMCHFMMQFLWHRRRDAGIFTF
jgi:hypothetical protein